MFCLFPSERSYSNVTLLLMCPLNLLSWPLNKVKIDMHQYLLAGSFTKNRQILPQYIVQMLTERWREQVKIITSDSGSKYKRARIRVTKFLRLNFREIEPNVIASVQSSQKYFGSMEEGTKFYNPHHPLPF